MAVFHFDFPTPVANTPYRPRAFIIDLSGPGVAKVKDDEIIRGLIQSGAISETTAFYFSRPQSSFQRVIEIKSEKSKFKLDGTKRTEIYEKKIHPS